VSPSPSFFLPNVIKAFCNTVMLLHLLLLRINCMAMYHVAMLHFNTIYCCVATAQLICRPPHCGGFYHTHTVRLLWTSDQPQKKPLPTQHITQQTKLHAVSGIQTADIITQKFRVLASWDFASITTVFQPFINSCIELINSLKDDIGRNGTRK